MTFKLNISSAGIDHKPSTPQEKAQMKISTGAHTAELSVDELAALVRTGHTFSRCAAKGMRNADFIQQQVLFTDIDNDMDTIGEGGGIIQRCIDNPVTISKALDICREHGIVPLMAYETFSSSHSWPRLRIGALLEQPVIDAETAKRLNRKFRALFRGGDERTDDVNHMLYGTASDKPIWYDRNPVANALNIIDGLPEPRGAPGRSTKPSINPERFTAPQSEMRDFLENNIRDILGYFSPRLRDEWIKVGYALKHEGFDFQVWHEWSLQGGEKYKGENDCIVNWNGMHIDDRSINGGYLIGEATKRGWKPAPERITESYRRNIKE